MNRYSGAAPIADSNNDELVAQNTELVTRIARHLVARLPSSIEIDDLIQSGMIGLLEAANNFDPRQGASFETYAGIRIRGSMIDDIRKHDWTPRSVHQKYRKIAESINSLEGSLGRPATSAEIAEDLELSVNDYHKALADSSSSRLFSLEETLERPSGESCVPHSATATPEQALNTAQFRDRLADEIDKLPEKEKLVLSLYYERELNFREIGEVLDVTESRVCQIHGQSLIRLRAVIENW
ncbi:MAG: RNA polymerase sigma factor FliA [Pseudomonadota bacterium]